MCNWAHTSAYIKYSHFNFFYSFLHVSFLLQLIKTNQIVLRLQTVLVIRVLFLTMVFIKFLVPKVFFINLSQLWMWLKITCPVSMLAPRWNQESCFALTLAPHGSSSCGRHGQFSKSMCDSWHWVPMLPVGLFYLHKTIKWMPHSIQTPCMENIALMMHLCWTELLSRWCAAAYTFWTFIVTNFISAYNGLQ